jgi:hypothetical protein
MTALDSVRVSFAIVLIAAGAAACRRDQLAGDAGRPTRGVPAPSLGASSSPVPPSSAPEEKGRGIAPRPGTVTSLLRPTLRVTPGIDAVELCRSRTCGAPQRVEAGADGHATPAADLDPGTWFWRVAGGKKSPPGPLWSIVIRRAAGRSSRVHGFDANGDGIADVPIEASLLLGSAGALADKLTRIPYATLDAVATEAPAARSPSTLVFAVAARSVRARRHQTRSRRRICRPAG